MTKPLLAHNLDHPRPNLLWEHPCISIRALIVLFETDRLGMKIPTTDLAVDRESCRFHNCR